MAEEQHEPGSSSNAGNSGGANEAAAAASPSLRRPSAGDEKRSANSTAGRVGDPEMTGGSRLHRSGTMPSRSGPGNGAGISTTDNLDIPTRRRGRTLSSKREANPLHSRPLSPRSQIFRRAPSNNKADSEGRDGGLDAIPERGQPGLSPSDSVPRGTMNSERPSFGSSGLRPRISTWAASPTPNRPRGSTLTRRTSVALVAQATGRDMDAQSQSNFTFAGLAPMETIQANQPYVDPGYAELNPAYDQPANTRPVWGLAKPLPRVIRPGMRKTRTRSTISTRTGQSSVYASENLLPSS
jgi:aquaglyceroporin related protein